MASHPADVRVIGARLHFLPVRTRVPLKFGPETLTTVTCARVCVRVRGLDGREAEGWGETPLSVQWVWPSALPYEERHAALRVFSERLCAALIGKREGHALELGLALTDETLPPLLARFNEERAGREPMPWLAALVCASAFDLAMHDAYGVLHGRPVYETYGRDFLSEDLSRHLEAEASFAGRYPGDFLVPRVNALPAWHLVGGLDALTAAEVGPDAPDDGYPVHLEGWIQRDGLHCLKIKLQGTDAGWDEARIRAVDAVAHGAATLSLDFNCTVNEPAYVAEILDRLRADAPGLFTRILYVEQPFPYDLEAHQIDVRAVSARRPLFMDESAHDWRLVRLGRQLGWTGVALKTCKTQSGALLALAWARAHGMALMVQDLTNPMLAMIPHALLAAHAGTIRGLETNACQFYPAASAAEETVHPGLYRRRSGKIDLSTVAGPGFGYRVAEISRGLPPPAAEARP